MHVALTRLLIYQVEAKRAVRPDGCSDLNE